MLSSNKETFAFGVFPFSDRRGIDLLLHSYFECKTLEPQTVVYFTLFFC
jgi:hypothetical protein